MSNPYNLTATRTASIMHSEGVDAKIALRSGETLYAKVIAPLDADDVFTVLAWGRSEARRLRRTDVKYAASAKVSWEMRRITREQRERYT